MIPLRSIPTLAISICALVFVAWIASRNLASSGLYADPSPPSVAAAAPSTTSPG